MTKSNTEISKLYLTVLQDFKTILKLEISRKNKTFGKAAESGLLDSKFVAGKTFSVAATQLVCSSWNHCTQFSSGKIVILPVLPLLTILMNGVEAILDSVTKPNNEK